MISPILSAQDADTVALDLGVFIAERARTYRTSQSAIIAALRPYIAPEAPASEPPPSQPEEPEPIAPVDGTPAVPPASETTDGEGASSSSLPASPSVTNQTTGDAKFRDPNDWEDEDVPLVEAPVSLPSARLNPLSEEAPARRRVSRVVSVSLQEKAQKLKSMHPTWTPFMIAKEIGASVDNVLIALGRLSGQGEPPEALKGQEAQRAHYAAVAKRLGRSR